MLKFATILIICIMINNTVPNMINIYTKYYADIVINFTEIIVKRHQISKQHLIVEWHRLTA